MDMQRYQQQLTLMNQDNVGLKDELRSLRAVIAAQERSRLEVVKGGVYLVKELEASAVIDGRQRQVERNQHDERMERIKEVCCALERSATLDLIIIQLL